MVFLSGLLLFFGIRGAEYWTGEAPRIGRWVGAADWTGFGSGSAWLFDFWVSVLRFDV